MHCMRISDTGSYDGLEYVRRSVRTAVQCYRRLEHDIRANVYRHVKTALPIPMRTSHFPHTSTVPFRNKCQRLPNPHQRRILVVQPDNCCNHGNTLYRRQARNHRRPVPGHEYSGTVSNDSACRSRIGNIRLKVNSYLQMARRYLVPPLHYTLSPDVHADELGRRTYGSTALDAYLRISRHFLPVNRTCLWPSQDLRRTCTRVAHGTLAEDAFKSLCLRRISPIGQSSIIMIDKMLQTLYFCIVTT